MTSNLDAVESCLWQILEGVEVLSVSGCGAQHVEGSVWPYIVIDCLVCPVDQSCLHESVVT